jgi:hypothetical protein
MKNLILLFAIMLLSSTAYAGNCENGTCRTPVRSSLSHAIVVTKNVVTAPVRVTKNVTTNVRCRRSCRRL